MLANYTDINILLDASASMAGTAVLTRNSLVEFVREQKTVPGAANLTLVEFHTPHHFVYRATNLPLQAWNSNEMFQYNPQGGSTALRDAWLRLMAERGQQFASQHESARPNKVIFVVITDGLDNASGNSSYQVRNIVKQQEQKYGWQFVYLGANQDAIREGSSYGLSVGSTLTYAPTSVNLATSSLSKSVSTYRTSVDNTWTAFSEEDRENSVKGDNK